MSEQTKSIGEMPINGTFIRQDDTAISTGGMTYRQWLIGMCISGIINANREEFGWDVHEFADDAVAMADAIIKRLDEESTNK
jgi:hypothetical protein